MIEPQSVAYQMLSYIWGWNLSVTSYLIEPLHNLSYSNCETIHIVKHGGVLIHTLQTRSLRFQEVDGVKHGHTHVFWQRQCLDQFS